MIIEAALISVLVLAPEVQENPSVDNRVICEYEARVSHDTQALRTEYPHWAQLAGLMRQVFKPGRGLQEIEKLTRNVYNSYEAHESPTVVWRRVYDKCIDDRGTKL